MWIRIQIVPSNLPDQFLSVFFQTSHKIHLMYSTPSCYLKSVNNANGKRVFIFMSEVVKIFKMAVD